MQVSVGRQPAGIILTMKRAWLALVVCMAAGSALADAPARRITAWPLVYHSATADEAETDILWPLLRYERKGSYTRYAFRPFIFSTESDPTAGRSETSVLWPLCIRRHAPGEDWFHIFPVYWDAQGKGYDLWQLWPLYGVYHRGGWTEYSTLFPFFRYGADAGSDDWAVHAPWPLIGYERAGPQTSHRVLPLYSYTASPGASRGFVLPYFWNVEPDTTTRGLVPFWFSRDTPDHDTTLVLPLYFNDEKPGEELTFITPLYFDRQTDDTRLRVLLPLYAGYETPGFGITVGLPVYGRFTTTDSRFTTVLPVYFHYADDSLAREFTYYFPFYGSYRRGDTVSQHYLMFPLYSQLEDAELELQAWDVLWPLFHYETSPATFDVRALPFYWRSHARGRDWTYAMLLYGALESPGRERRWLLPFYFHKADGGAELTLGSLALLPPYYLSMERGGSSRFHVWPFYGVDRDSGYVERSVAWPLFRFGENTDGSRSQTQVLLYFHSRQGAETTTVLVPVWYHGDSPAKTVDATPVLHWYEHEPAEQRTRWAFLWLAPPEGAIVRYATAPGFLSHGLFPLYGYERDERDDHLSWSMLWPLLSYSSDGPVATQTDFLWKVITYERTDAQTRDFRFLWRFVRSSEAPGSSIFEFNPFYYHETEAGQGDYWNVLGGLIGKRTAEDGTTEMQWLWFF